MLASPPSHHSTTSILTAPSFIGRAAELGALQRALDWARAWRGDVLIIEAPSGGGKSRLLDRAVELAREQGVRVLRGRALDQLHQRPLQILEQIALEVLTAARSDPGFAEAVRARLGVDCAAVSAALPQLAELCGPLAAENAAGLELHGEARSLHALEVLLRALGEPGHPALVVLDDCQWMDGLSLKLIAHWRARRSGEERDQVLLLLAFRSEEVPPQHPLRALQPLLHLTLSPLQRHDLKALLESMAGPLPDACVSLVEQLSGGSPFFARAVLEGLAEAGALFRAPGGWQLAPGALPDVSASAVALLRERLDRLPPAVSQLLTAGALLGREFETAVAAELTALSLLQARAALIEARRRTLVWADDSLERATLVHDRLRDAFLARLDADERVRMHRRAAELLERRAPDRVFEIAGHFDAAGEGRRALPHALKAAGQARARSSLELAEKHYRIAERGSLSAEPPLRRAVLEGLGDVLLLLGRYQESRELFQAALQLEGGPVNAARLSGKLGELAFKRGDLAGAASEIERGLLLLGHRVPSKSGAVRLLALWQGLLQILHSVLPALFVARRDPRSAPTDLLAVRLLNRLQYSQYFSRGGSLFFWTQLRELNLAERTGETPELANAWAMHSLTMFWARRAARGERYAQRALLLCRKLGDLWGEAHAFMMRGVGLLSISRYRDSLASFEAAEALYARAGDRWEMNAAVAGASLDHYWLGELRAARDKAQRAFRVGRAGADAHGMALAVKVWSLCTGGALPAEVIDEARSPKSADVQIQSWLAVADGVRLLRLGRADEAAALLGSAGRALARTHVRVDTVCILAGTHATALRVAAAQATEAARAPILREARVAAERAVKLGRRFGNHLSAGLRERGLLRVQAGDGRGARRDLDESVAAAQSRGALFEQAQALLARGLAGSALGWPGAERELAAAHETLATMGIDFALGALL